MVHEHQETQAPPGHNTKKKRGRKRKSATSAEQACNGENDDRSTLLAHSAASTDRVTSSGHAFKSQIYGDVKCPRENEVLCSLSLITDSQSKNVRYFILPSCVRTIEQCGTQKDNVGNTDTVIPPPLTSTASQHAQHNHHPHSTETVATRSDHVLSHSESHTTANGMHTPLLSATIDTQNTHDCCQHDKSTTSVSSSVPPNVISATIKESTTQPTSAAAATTTNVGVTTTGSSTTTTTATTTTTHQTTSSCDKHHDHHVQQCLPQDHSFAYPIQSNEPCYQCREKFTTIPIKIPMQWDARDGYAFWGNFCWFPCALGFIRDHMRGQTASMCVLLLHKFALEFWGIQDLFKPVAPIYCLDTMGGDMSVERYRTDVSPRLIHHPSFIPYLMLVECHDVNTATSASHTLQNRIWSIRDIQRRIAHNVTGAQDSQATTTTTSYPNASCSTSNNNHTVATSGQHRSDDTQRCSVVSATGSGCAPAPSLHTSEGLFHSFLSKKQQQSNNSTTSMMDCASSLSSSLQTTDNPPTLAVNPEMRSTAPSPSKRNTTAVASSTARATTSKASSRRAAQGNPSMRPPISSLSSSGGKSSIALNTTHATTTAQKRTTINPTTSSTMTTSDSVVATVGGGTIKDNGTLANSQTTAPPLKMTSNAQPDILSNPNSAIIRSRASKKRLKF